MTKFLSVLFLMCLAVLTSVLVMMYGWGLQPKSWWWIIGAGIFANTVIRMLSDKITKSED